MGFKEIFKSAWADFKLSLNAILKVNFWYVLFPFLIIALFLVVALAYFGIFSELKQTTSSFFDLASSATTPEELESIADSNQGLFLNTFLKVMGIFVLAFVLIIFAFFVNMFGYLCTILVKGKESFRDLRKKAKPYYWRFVGLSVLLVLIAIGVSIAVMLVFMPFAVLISVLPLSSFFAFLFEIVFYVLILFFSVKFVFAPFILVYENKGVGKSISHSWNLSKGRMWKVFGYLLLIALIYYFFSMLFYVFLLIVLFVVALPIISEISVAGASPSFEIIWNAVWPMLIIAGVAYFVYSLLLYLLFVPFAVLFIRSLYFELRKRRNGKSLAL